MIINMKKIDPIPPGSNPFDNDWYNMGTKIGKDLIMMYANHPHQQMKYMILVDIKTGDRFKINIYQLKEMSNILKDHDEWKGAFESHDEQ